MNRLQQELISLANTAPLNGYVVSVNFPIIDIKERYDKSDYYLVELLEKLERDGEIRELIVNYDKDDRHILSFKFR